MSIRSLRHLSVTAVLVLALAACGGDDDSSSDPSGSSDLSSEEQAFVDASLEGYDAEEAGLAEADARCMSASLVQELGTEKLEDLGITPEEFASEAEFPEIDEDQAEAVVDRIEKCLDLRALMLAGFAEGGELTEDQETCLSDAITDEIVHDLMVASVRGVEPDGVGDDFFQVISGCMGLTDAN